MLLVRKVFEMSNNEAFALFREVRWDKGYEVVRPVCVVHSPNLRTKVRLN
jgi:hypothetical protein